MIKGFKIRLFPNEKQEQLLWKHINGSRFVWNYTLSVLIERYKNGESYLNKYSTRDMFKNMKQTKELASRMDEMEVKIDKIQGYMEKIVAYIEE